jgi:hypothetical protein
MFSAFFTRAEFERASTRPLLEYELQVAERWSSQILPPAREIFGPLLVTSFVRTAKPGTGGLVPELGPHSYGVAVDVVRLDRRGDPGANRALADFFASRFLPSGELVQVIDERTHVHLANRLVTGATAGYLHEPTEGRFVLADIPAAIADRPFIGAGALVAVAAVILLVARK